MNWPKDEFALIPRVKFSHTAWSSGKDKVSITHREIFIDVVNDLIWIENGITHLCSLTNFTVDLENKCFILPIVKIFCTFQRSGKSRMFKHLGSFPGMTLFFKLFLKISQH